jgi:uncharacterized protein
MLYSALILGVLGSFHCVGMCGPISWVAGGKLPGRWLRHKVLYNLGRTLTYAVLGGVMGLFGEIIALGVMQKGLSIGMAIGIVGYVLATHGRLEPAIPGWMQQGVGKLRMGLGHFMKKSSHSASFTTGVLNGLLPCGLVYAALLLSIGTGSTFNGSMYMAVFGLGTIPAMLAMGLAGDFIGARWKKSFTRAVPVVMLIMAGLFVFRSFHVHSAHPHEADYDNSEITLCKGD